ncbi:MAG: hypothetical protein NTW87_02845, partial [Planctomycetota bacterium]|nr:hypothetical protein [Planctomycetota bacterium]
QRLLDGSDRSVAVRLKQIGGAAEVTVRVSLPGRGDKPITVKVPPDSQTIVDFAADALPLGRHELKAELADAPTPYIRTLTFERIRGPFER